MFSPKGFLKNKKSEFDEISLDKYPTLKKYLITYRDEYIADKINDLVRNNNNICMIIGKSHIEGIINKLDDKQVEIKYLN